jgi:DNA-binding Lrp family transcriptional regulator
LGGGGSLPDRVGTMETVYLLAETDVGVLDDVMKRIRGIPNVSEVEAVTGPFDVIVKIQARHINEALDVIVHRIRRIPGVKSTETLVAVSGP